MRSLKRVFAFVTLMTAFALGLRAQSTISQAQAIFLFNFTKLVEWPLEYQKGDFVIGVCGNPEFYQNLQTYLKGKTVGNQPIKAVNYPEALNVGRCHILFVAYSKTKDMEVVKDRISGNKTLVITEKTGALSTGSSINFVVLDDKLKFELNTKNATKCGLKVSSSLQTMAVVKN